MAIGGYTNWQTWNCVNWYDTLIEDLTESTTRAEDFADQLEEYVREDITESATGFALDILYDALEEINFMEIARDHLEDREDTF